MIFYLNRIKMKTRTIIKKRFEFVCSVMNNKVYYSEKEQKRIARRMFVLNNMK